MTLWPWLHCSTKLLIKNIALQTAKGSANLSAEKCNMNRGGTASYLAWPGGKLQTWQKCKTGKMTHKKGVDKKLVCLTTLSYQPISVWWQLGFIGWHRVDVYNNIILSTWCHLGDSKLADTVAVVWPGFGYWLLIGFSLPRVGKAFGFVVALAMFINCTI